MQTGNNLHSLNKISNKSLRSFAIKNAITVRDSYSKNLLISEIENGCGYLNKISWRKLSLEKD
ncbi:304R [Invertebrate iridescent virus Kaz2018]|uniref:304R n=2 Tax=Iridovirus TaxID=10487 RepID=Q91FM0_IIV6|nr:304R [Invertebrate iridescent virus 6]AAK82165.1 304R [Invertebrate iridescent virus 6]QMS79605.1 hypothetical protein IIV6-T1_298 [Invertebrate iridescent virus 6]QNH08714.1 304R [Invertebrate iridescent virus Kaz2018]